MTRGALGGYVAHRLSVAGGVPNRVIFPADALDAVFEGSGGVPRLINRICDRTMQQGFLARTGTMSRDMVEAAIRGAGTSELPGALAARPSRAPLLVAEAEPRPQGVDAWLKSVDVGPAIAPPSDAEGLHEFTTELETPFAEAAREPQWVLGPMPRERRKRWRLPARFAMPRELAGRRLKTAAAAVMAVTVSGMGLAVPALPDPLAEGTLPIPSAPVLAIASLAAPAPVPMLSDGPVTQTGESAVAAMPAATTAPATIQPASRTTATDAADEGYVLEVALFGSRQRGARLVEELVAAGFRAFDQPLDLGPRGSFRQVLVGPFSTREDADRDLERLRQRGGYTDARIAARPPARVARTTE
jgi:cell division septation protein DedD